MTRFPFWAGLFLVLLSGCEGEFAGNRPFDLTKLNRPYGMRWVKVGGTDYLAVTNTNALGDQSSGSMQFYTVDETSGFSLNQNLSFAIPNNVLDFYYDETLDRLFILDRNQNRVLVYERDGNGFFPRKEKGKIVEIPLLGNPVSLTPWIRDASTPDAAPYLAILTEGSGSIQFLNRESLHLFNLDDLKQLDEKVHGKNNTSIRTLFQGTRVNQIGAFLKLRSRTSTDAIRDISSGEAEGRGIGKILTPIATSNNNPYFVVASFVDEAIFGFRFYDFDNISNLLFNPRTAIRGTTGIKGTKEDGFRGMDRDASDNFYFTCRSNNKLYQIPASAFTANRTAGTNGNTTAFAQDKNGGFMKDITFGGQGVDVSVGRHPRLGDIAVNGQGGSDPSGSLATRAWILGLENEKRGSSLSRVYSVNLGTSEVSEIVTYPADVFPQKLIYEPQKELLIVAGTNANRLYLYDVSGTNFTLIHEFPNP